MAHHTPPRNNQELLVWRCGLRHPESGKRGRTRGNRWRRSLVLADGVQLLQPRNHIREPSHVPHVQPGHNRLRRRTLPPHHHRGIERVRGMGTDQDVQGIINRSMIMWREYRFSLSRLDWLLWFSLLLLTIVQPHYYRTVRAGVLAVTFPLLAILQYRRSHRLASSSARQKWLIRRCGKGSGS